MRLPPPHLTAAQQYTPNGSRALAVGRSPPASADRQVPHSRDHLRHSRHLSAGEPPRAGAVTLLLLSQGFGRCRCRVLASQTLRPTSPAAPVALSERSCRSPDSLPCTGAVAQAEPAHPCSWTCPLFRGPVVHRGSHCSRSPQVVALLLIVLVLCWEPLPPLTVYTVPPEVTGPAEESAHGG